MINAQIIPNNNLNPKSKCPTINSTPMNPNAKPASTENTNCATAMSCLFICFTGKHRDKYKSNACTTKEIIFKLKRTYFGKKYCLLVVAS